MRNAMDISWMQRAVCRSQGSETFFPSDGRGVTAARKVCELCPVRQSCLDYAMTNEILHGVWGGTSERERARLRRSRRLKVTPAA